MTVLVWLVILGFPIALFVGWRYELTPDGIVRTTPTAAAAADTRLHLIDYGLFAALVTIVAVITMGLVSVVPESETPAFETGFEPGSIAILPFADLSPDRDQQHLAEGIADTLINRLGRYPHLQVIARTSSFAFKDKGVDVREIARRLNCGAILEGSLTKIDDGYRVTATLVDGRTGRQLMSEEFNRSGNELLLLQDEIARTVAQFPILNPPAQLTQFASDAPGNFESFELYVLGRMHWHKRTAESLRTAVRYFQQAIQQDPEYALAWSGLADSYSLLVQYANVPLETVIDDARRAIHEAKTLNPDLAEAHASEGLLALFAEDYAAASNALERAIALNPNYSMAYVWAGRTLFLQERYAEALAVFTDAIRLDPQTPITILNVALTYALLGHADKARPYYEKVLDIDPTFQNAYWGLGAIHWHYGDADWGAYSILQGIDYGLEQWDALLALAGAFVDLGRFDAAAERLDHAESVAGSGFWTAQARLYLLQTLGDFDDYHDLALRNLREEGADPYVIERLAFAKILLGRYEEALQYYSRADAIALDEKWITNHWALIWGRMPSVDWAFALLKTGNRVQAERLMDQAQKMWRSNRALGRFDVPIYYYMEACILALRDDRQGSLAALRKAFDNGWRRYRWAKLDPKLESLHDDPAFIALMEEIEAEVSRQEANLTRMLAEFRSAKELV